MRANILVVMLCLFLAAGCATNVRTPAPGPERTLKEPASSHEVKELAWGSVKISLGMTKAEVLVQIRKTWEGRRGTDDLPSPISIPSEETRKSDRWSLSYGSGSGGWPGGGGLTFVFEEGRLIRIILGPPFG